MKLIRYKYPSTNNPTPLSRLFNFGAPSIERFSQLFDDFYRVGSPADQLPADLYEDDANFYVRLELPGVDKDKINLELENGVLTCSGDYSEKTESRNAKYSFKRSISVPEKASADKVSASHKDGILTVTLPKKEAAEIRQIKVK